MAITRARFTEGASGFIRFRLVDQVSTPVETAALTAATLTLWDVDTFVPGSPARGILNARDAQDILGVGSPAVENDVTFEGNGYVRWDLQPEDNVIVTPRRQIERHRAQLVFAWTGGRLTYEIEIEVVNLRKEA